MAIMLVLYVAMGALMVDSLIELALVSSMVSWLHRTATGTIAVKDDGTTLHLAWKPKHLLVDQGHTTNGAAGTAFVLIGILGILVLWLQHRADKRPDSGIRRASKLLYRAWVVLSMLALLLTIGALGYVFSITNAHAGQRINVAAARTLNNGTINQSDQQSDKYPLDSWTPQGWFSAVLHLNLADARVRSDISHHLRIMRGWQYNLIVLFLLQLLTTGLILVDAVRRRQRRRKSMTV